MLAQGNNNNNQAPLVSRARPFIPRLRRALRKKGLARETSTTGQWTSNLESCDYQADAPTNGLLLPPLIGAYVQRQYASNK